ncbi:hypothetical protein AURDEDRAFT_105338 [Auricularia subglabra TFB-10046 SS5]|nr:hypothetical protein AURDEDRAFT_105338 [Auricularia subglabra TFB-10046 SS5]
MACAKKDWDVPAAPRAQTHSELCKDNQRHMKRLPDAVAIIKQFPWGRLEKDGTFSLDVARARFDVLGADGYGFWSHRGGPMAHANLGDTNILAMLGNSPQAQAMKKLFAQFDHLDGLDLLQKNHLNDAQGWKLPPKLVPLRDFENAPERKPVLVTRFDGGIRDWDSWYHWRQIPKESPAALLMDFPLSVYRLLTHCLRVTDADAGSKDKRIPVTIHYLGAEVELNFIPLFSELALLLPWHDIKLVFFGPSVHKLGDTAKEKKHAASLVTQSSTTQPVFDYTAPLSCGRSTLSAYLCTSTTAWSPRNPEFPAPDAIVACNAGLGSYSQWADVIVAAHALDIPFGVTEYAEQSAETQVFKQFPVILASARIPRKDEYKIEFNPFQRPGQRPLPNVRLPNLCNGFTITVVRKPEGEGADKGTNDVDDAAARFAAVDLDLD